MKIPIDTELTLRGFKDKDIPRIADLADNPNISRTLKDYFPYPYTRNDAIRFISQCRSQRPQETFAIDLNGEFVGTIGLKRGEDVFRFNAEVGYWIGEPYWGKGIASKSLSAIVQHGFDNWNVHRIFGRVFENNPASVQVFLNNGFVLEAQLKQTVFKFGRFYDELIFGRIKE